MQNEVVVDDARAPASTALSPRTDAALRVLVRLPGAANRRLVAQRCAGSLLRMSTGGFNYVEIAVSDMRRAADFYAAVFGWQFDTGGSPDYWGFAAGGGRGAILRHESRPTGGDNPIVYVTVDDLDAVLARVDDAGGRIEQGATPVPGGGRFAHLRDPDGTRIGAWETGAGRA